MKSGWTNIVLEFNNIRLVSEVYILKYNMYSLKKCFLPPANEVWCKVICLQACVCPQGGVPDQGHPPRPGTPRDQVHPPGPGTPQGTRYTPPGPGTPPWHRACWEIRSTRGPYASYWNTILFKIRFERLH